MEISVGIGSPSGKAMDMVFEPHGGPNREAKDDEH